MKRNIDSMRRKLRVPPALGVFGFLGILGFIYAPLFCIFFGFFGFFWVGLLSREKVDERLEENYKKGTSIATWLGLMLCFFILFALDKNIDADVVLKWGSIGYALVLILAPALTYYIDKRGD